MSLTESPKNLAADFFFVLQIGLALVSGGSQFFRLLYTSQGIHVSWLASWLAFLVINLTLSMRAHRLLPSRVTLQTVLVYGAWAVVIAADLMVLLVMGTVWEPKDSVTAAAVALGVLLTCWYARQRRLPVTDPMVNAGFAMCFIGLPQLTLAYNIFLVGGAGLAGLMLLAGHIGILTRMSLLWFAIREAGWDRNRVAAALGEGANEITWVLVTLAWLVG